MCPSQTARTRPSPRSTTRAHRRNHAPLARLINRVPAQRGLNRIQNRPVRAGSRDRLFVSAFCWRSITAWICSSVSAGFFSSFSQSICCALIPTGPVRSAARYGAQRKGPTQSIAYSLRRCSQLESRFQFLAWPAARPCHHDRAEVSINIIPACRFHNLTDAEDRRRRQRTARTSAASPASPGPRRHARFAPATYAPSTRSKDPCSSHPTHDGPGVTTSASLSSRPISASPSHASPFSECCASSPRESPAPRAAAPAWPPMHVPCVPSPRQPRLHRAYSAERAPANRPAPYANSPVPFKAQRRTKRNPPAHHEPVHSSSPQFPLPLFAFESLYPQSS